MTEASQGREESEEREQLLKSLEVKSALKKKLSAELEKYKSCDPERMKELRKMKLFVCNIETVLSKLSSGSLQTYQ